MTQHINETDLVKIIRNVIKESVGIPSEENHYISIMVPRIKSWMDEVYQDWGGIDAVSPEALTDFSNRNDYEDSLDTFSHEFNVDREELRPVFNKAIEIAHSQLKEDLLGEGKVVKRFTPFTDDEKKTNYECLKTCGFGRTPEERNPSYAKAKKEAEERRKQREAQKQNSDMIEAVSYGADRAASNNNYANRWFNQYAKPLAVNADKAIAAGDVQKMTYLYQRLSALYNSNPIKTDTRLASAKERIRNKCREIVNAVQSKMTQMESKNAVPTISEEKFSSVVKSVISEWKKSINEDSYSYNGLDQQAQYNKMGEDLYNEQQKPKIYKKNIMLFKRAFNKVYKEFTIIGTLKRKLPEAKDVFNGEAYLKFVEHTEGDSLYTPIWEKFGGEYLEMANTYLESYIIKFRRKLGMS